MPAPRVSLLASTYRSERFLGPWLESMARQTVWADAELIVVANDATDEELALLEPFAREHANVRIERVPREPLYRSWNRAIAAAAAPILAIANVDDLRLPDGLQRQVEALERDPAALFAYGGFTISADFPPRPDAPGAMIEVEPFDDPEPFTRGMLLGPFMVWRATEDPAMRFFDEQLKVGGDMDLAIRLALHGRGIKVDGSLGSYYNAGTGLSTGGDTQPIERTVLELRYGIYDKLELEWLPQAAQYVIPRLLMPDGAWLAVADVVPDYDAWMQRRRDTYFKPPRKNPVRKLVQAIR